MADNCGADVLANQLMDTLLNGEEFELPEVDLTGAQFQAPTTTVGPAPEQLNTDDLTTGAVNGTGSFDKIMSSLSAHLKSEFDKGRITGEFYTKAYIAMTETALSSGVQFLLGRDSAFWQAVTARSQAEMAQVALVTERVKLEIAKTQLKAMRFEALNNEATYALTKMKLATENVQFCTGQYNLANILPEQKLMLVAQRHAAEEGLEAARAQTLDTRSDGTPVTGLLGRQKALYAQQIISYQRDAENKVAKLWSDAWITMKTMDEGLLPPTQFTNANFDGVLTQLRARVYLDGTTPPDPLLNGGIGPGAGDGDDGGLGDGLGGPIA